MAKLIFEVNDHGVEHAQYFQGVGISGTEWERVALGAGSTAREAGEDALAQFYEQVAYPLEEIPEEEREKLDKEIEALDNEDAHDDCWIEFKNSWEPKRVWTVTIQKPHDGEPAPRYVEISSGTEHFSPGALAKPIFTSSDPEEIVQEARAFARRKAGPDLKIYFGSAEFGTGAEDHETEESLETWAAKQKDQIEEDRQAAYERAHEECELYHYVSIRWRAEERPYDPTRDPITTTK